MRWPTHQVGAIATALFLHLSPVGIGAAIFGGIMPDVFDQKLASLFYKKRSKGWGKVHRGITHWWGLWLGAFLGTMAVQEMGLWGETARHACLGLTIGGISHVLLDMLNPRGVPLFPFVRRHTISLKCCTTGSIGEWLVAIAIIAAAGFFLRDDLLVLVHRLGAGF